ncbi:ATP-dependent RNA helicase DBP7 [Coprinopsis sp. MPI-PUGE-AT-0042]|nr:ATP-dependent RNA helicase DBP7 [Coprinopsis sp. MPI-PUGE-AT-0042]
MDDGLVLNLAADDDWAPKRAAEPKKGGKWTERLKAKRSAKRKVSTREKGADNTSGERPAKRPRTESTTSIPSQPTPKTAKPATHAAPAKPQAQVISSLFTSNPKFDLPKPAPANRALSKPSNAPMDSSTFEGAGLHPLLISHLASKMNIKKPTAIQKASLPAMLEETENENLRDVFIQSQTGSGKTLSYVLPIIQDLLPLSSYSYIDRSIGTLAIIIAPTRELAKQIHDVIEALLKMRLRAEDDADGSEGSGRMTRWLVSGLLIGGSTRAHEKARLRKGCPILVSTPGRLLDHIQNTSSFNVGKCRWLVLDEADQLMELGFEETITGILRGLEGRRKLALQAVQEGKSMEVGGWDWERRRRTVLCSATLRDSVQTLVGTTLINPVMIKALEADKDEASALDALATGKSMEGPTQSLTPPSQLSQKYVIVPLKLRLVALVALLRTLIAQAHGGSKIIVFLSCTDSVDFHFSLLGGTQMGGAPSEEEGAESDEDESDDGDDSEGKAKGKTKAKSSLHPYAVETQCALIPDASIYRLHGSLPTAVRQRALKGFAGPKGKNQPKSTTTSSILLCTSVASRGLDLPLVKAVIQYDLPTEGGENEYIHRVGRTARAGQGGEAWSMVSPSEAEWVKWIEERIQGDGDEKAKKEKKAASLVGVPMDNVLQNGYGGKGKEYESRATEAQLSFERWVLKNSENASLARKAYLSHMRAYATHPSAEKHMFHIRHLHLGHLAKSFALREAPTRVTASNASKPSKFNNSKSDHHSSKNKNDVKSKAQSLKAKQSKGKATAAAVGKTSTFEVDSDEDQPWNREGRNVDTEKRMQEIVRSQGRLTKKGGAMVSTGVSEFQIMGGDSLEKLLNR